MKDPDCPVGLEYGNHPLGSFPDCTCTPEPTPRPTLAGGNRLADVLSEVYAERRRQDAKWGGVETRTDLPSATPLYQESAPHVMGAIDLGEFAYLVEQWGRNSMRSEDTAAGILAEEVGEALAEAARGDQAKLREELIQVAAVAVFWVELLDLGLGGA